MRIELPEAFDMAVNLGYLTRTQQECMHEVNGGSVRKAISAGKDRFLVEIASSDNQTMSVRFLNDSPSLSQREGIAAYIREWFDLDRDLTGFYRMAQEDGLLREAVQRLRGLRLIGMPDLFETLCWGVIGQQISLSAAYALKRRFVEAFGESLEWDGRAYRIFPSCERIARLTPADLASCKLSARKSEYLIGIARRMADGQLSKDMLLNISLKEAEKRLTAVRGIGPWTAHYVMMRCLRHPAAFPVDDAGLINAIKTVGRMARKPTRQEVLKLAEPWKGWEAYAVFYLWRMLY
jgi:DNA-3-methyladenine glycosylase II